MRKILLALALAASGCSYSEEAAQIFVHVDGIPTAADHLDVVLTPSDTTIAGKNCPSTLTPAPASNATCYRPSFQPAALASGSLDLAFVQPTALGTVTVSVSAADRAQTQLAQGTVSCVLPCPLTLPVVLH